MDESPETKVARLNLEFDQMLADMKPHVMRLPHKSGIFFILCDHSRTCSSGLLIDMPLRVFEP